MLVGNSESRHGETACAVVLNLGDEEEPCFVCIPEGVSRCDCDII